MLNFQSRLGAFLGLIIISSTGAALAATPDYRYLKKTEVQEPKNWSRESDNSARAMRVEAPSEDLLNLDLNPYYAEFEGDGVVKVFLGWGVEAWSSDRVQSLKQQIESIAATERLPIKVEVQTERPGLLLRQENRGVTIQIDTGHERNEYANAFKDYEIVMYHGHSRYGQGPAFEGFQNYFRMGDVFQTIEVDTRNPYFSAEPILNTAEFPLLDVTLDNANFQYQYRGPKTEQSYLPSDSYTKMIPGGDKDLKTVEHSARKQIIWLYSCRNVYYFKNPLRAMFPNVNERAIFGTQSDGYWGNSPAAVFLAGLTKHFEKSREFVDGMNATGDCSNCFTTY